MLAIVPASLPRGDHGGWPWGIHPGDRWGRGGVPMPPVTVSGRRVHGDPLVPEPDLQHSAPVSGATGAPRAADGSVSEQNQTRQGRDPPWQCDPAAYRRDPRGRGPLWVPLPL